jgi:hypothetical protein
MVLVSERTGKVCKGFRTPSCPLMFLEVQIMGKLKKESKPAQNNDKEDGSKKVEHHTPRQVTGEEKKILKWFLDKEFDEGEKNNYMEHYLYCMGWLYLNSMVLLGNNPLQEAFLSIEIIKKKNPKLFKTYMSTCTSQYNKYMEELQPKKNIIKFPKEVIN